MTVTDPRQVSHADLDWCYNAVQDVSRTFALTVSELNEPMSRYVCAGYLLCRIADTVEDATHIPAEEQHALLEQYQAALSPASSVTAHEFREDIDAWVPDNPNADWGVVQETSRVVETFQVLDEDARDAMRPPVLEMIDGMSMFVDRYAEEGGIRIQTMDELEEYCWYVAGTVGSLVTNLLAPVASPDQQEVMDDTARSFALLLQLVNVAKDVQEDFREENNVYLPQSILQDHGVHATDIPEQSAAEEFAPAIEDVVARAEQYADDAERWITALPEDAQGTTLSAVAIPYLLAIATLRELKARPEDVIATGGVKVSREEVFALLGRFHTGDDPSVSELREIMATRPLHEA